MFHCTTEVRAHNLIRLIEAASDGTSSYMHWNVPNEASGGSLGKASSAGANHVGHSFVTGKRKAMMVAPVSK